MPAADDWEESCCGLSASLKDFRIMKKTNSISTVLTLLSMLCFSTEFLPAQPTATNQVITLQVLEFNKITIVSPTMVIATIDKESYHSRGLEAQAAAKLVWTSNGEEQKITVACLRLFTGAHLRIEVREWQGSREITGTSITLSDALTYDLLRGLSRSAGHCELKYSLHASEITGGKDQIVVYTVTSG